ncbi:MAG: YdeI/OmpD-associated family protein [Chloroflexi bacterium]|nr:YdeI/OmpD-associated family protein [Chloroflexota bacterium]
MESTTNYLGNLPVILFAHQAAWTVWLAQHHATSTGLWLQLTKKASGLVSVSYAEALDVALCYGWIDGQKKSYDETSWLQKFTPRGAKSLWSKINREKAQVLIENGQMQPAGLQAIIQAQQDGRWAAAYDSSTSATVPEDFQVALDGNAAAKAFFDTLTRANRYAMLFRIQTAKKAETRAKRIQQFIQMLENHETIHA